MNKNASDTSDARVVPLRKSLPPQPAAGTPSNVPPVDDLSRYQDAEQPDEYRHRMITNVAAVAFVMLLIVAGIWIADTMASMKKNQDCVLSGRRGCTPVDAPPPQRW